MTFGAAAARGQRAARERDTDWARDSGSELCKLLFKNIILSAAITKTSITIRHLVLNEKIKIVTVSIFSNMVFCVKTKQKEINVFTLLTESTAFSRYVSKLRIPKFDNEIRQKFS